MEDETAVGIAVYSFGFVRKYVGGFGSSVWFPVQKLREHVKLNV